MEGWRVAHTERSFSLAPCLVFLRPSWSVQRRIPLSFLPRWLRRALGIPTELIGHLCSTYVQGEKWRPFFWFISQLVLPPPYNKRPHTHVGYPQSPRSASHPVIQLSFLWMAGWLGGWSWMAESEKEKVRESESARHSSLTSRHV